MTDITVYTICFVLYRLHLKIKNEQKKNIKYEDKLYISNYQTRAAEKDVKRLTKVVEENKNTILYNQIDILKKYNQIENLKVKI